MSQSHPRKRPAPPKAPRAGRRFPWWTLPVLALCVCLLGAAWVFADEALISYDKFNTMRMALAGDTFHGEVIIDGVPLSGLTRDEAEARLHSDQAVTLESFGVVLVAGEYRWRISSDEVPLSLNTGLLLDKAYMIGRVGSIEQRYSQATTIHLEWESELTYDRAAVRELTEKVAQRLTIEGKNATVVAFDVENRSFAFSDEVVGQTVDAELLYQSVINFLDHGQYGAEITVLVQNIDPTVTRAQLEESYTLIGHYTTETTKDDNRNTNIRLAAEAINGQMVLPGAEFSFNQTTGQRTVEKGYKEAGAIENGRTVQEVGGGICQVSSTLFNAMLRANCEIVSRKPHAWPSDYVPRGEDATVDWPNLDLVMRNASDSPIFITAWYENRTVTVDIYGFSLGTGVSIELESETTYSKKPTEVVYTYNANLRVGTTQLLKKPRTGYTVETYKIWLRDGEEVSREKLYTSNYKAINEEYEYNDGKPPAGT